jgi:hypothetical protein
MYLLGGHWIKVPEFKGIICFAQMLAEIPFNQVASAASQNHSQDS